MGRERVKPAPDATVRSEAHTASPSREHSAHRILGGTNLSNRRMRTRMYGGVAGESGRPLPLCRLARNGLVSHILMCDNLHMPTNLAIDDKLIEEARRLGEHKTKKEAVTTALEEYIQHRRQQQILEDFGTVDFDPEYDYKAERRRKRM